MTVIPDKIPEDFVAGLDGVVAFTTEIAEPDKDGGALRYRGVDIEDLVGRQSPSATPGLCWWTVSSARAAAGRAVPAPDPQRRRPRRRAGRPGDAGADLGRGPCWTSMTHRPRSAGPASVMALSYVAQSARGIDQPAVPQRIIDECRTVTERFMTRWQASRTPTCRGRRRVLGVGRRTRNVRSTFTARVIASTGADVAAALSGAIGAMSGPLHGGAPARVLPMLEEVERTGDARGLVKGILDRNEKLMGFGHRVYRAEDPRARVLRATATAGRTAYEVALRWSRPRCLSCGSGVRTGRSRPTSNSGRR